MTNEQERAVAELRCWVQESVNMTLTQDRIVSSRSYTERLESKWVAKEPKPDPFAGVWTYPTNYSYVITNYFDTNHYPGRPWLATNAYLMESPK